MRHRFHQRQGLLLLVVIAEKQGYLHVHALQTKDLLALPGGYLLEIGVGLRVVVEAGVLAVKFRLVHGADGGGLHQGQLLQAYL